MKKRPVFSAIIALSWVLPAAAQDSGSDWPNWRGPNHDGISRETGFRSEGTVAWRADVGLGYSAVSVADTLLYTQGFDPKANEDKIVCLNARTGDKVWQHSFPAKIHNKFHAGGTLVTPVIDSGKLYTCTREGDFLCLDAGSGAVLWSRNLHKKHGLEYPTWMFSGSPLVLGDYVFINMGVLFCFEKSTGKKVWTTKNTGHAYSTPAPMQLEGRDSLAVFNGNGLSIFGQKDGKELCSYPWQTKHSVNAATPVIVDDNMIFISSGYGRGCAMLEVAGGEVNPVWESKVMRTQMSGSTVYDDYLYGYDDSVFKCIDLEGNEQWKLRGSGKGTHIIADKRLILLTGDGELVLAKATPDKFEELSRQKVLDGGVYWTTPVLANGRIYCRNNEGKLVCVDYSGTAQPR